MRTKFQVPIFCVDPVSARVTVGLGGERGDLGCGWCRGNLVSAEDDILGLVQSVVDWPPVKDLVPFPGAPLDGEGFVGFPQPTSTTFPLGM